MSRTKRSVFLASIFLFVVMIASVSAFWPVEWAKERFTGHAVEGDPKGCVRNAPFVTWSAGPSSTYVGKQSRFIIKFTNQDSASCPPSVFSVSVEAPEGFETDVADSVSIAPGSSSSLPLKFTLPEDAPLGKYIITYTVENTASEKKKSTSFSSVALPYLAELEPNSSYIGNEVTLSGFGLDKTTGVVFLTADAFRSTSVPVKDAAATTATFVVPATFPGSAGIPIGQYKVALKSRAGVSNTLKFTLVNPPCVNRVPEYIQALAFPVPGPRLTRLMDERATGHLYDSFRPILTYRVVVRFRNADASYCSPSIFDIVPTLPEGWVVSAVNSSKLVKGRAFGEASFEFSIPRSVPPGLTEFSFDLANRDVSELSLSHAFKVEVLAEPYIESVEPSSASVGDFVVLNGYGFSLESNRVIFRDKNGYVNRVHVIGPSADGVSLNIKIPPQMYLYDSSGNLIRYRSTLPGSYNISMESQQVRHYFPSSAASTTPPRIVKSNSVSFDVV